MSKSRKRALLGHLGPEHAGSRVGGGKLRSTPVSAPHMAGAGCRLQSGHVLWVGAGVGVGGIYAGANGVDHIIDYGDSR